MCSRANVSTVQFAFRRHRRQLQVSPDAGVDFIAVDNRYGPFSRSDVRKAFWAALNRQALSRAAGSPLTARLATHFLYPGIPGFEQAESLISPRKLTYVEHPTGDIALARRYMKHAGFASGRYTGPGPLLVVGSSDSASDPATIAATRALSTLGFKSKLLLVSPAAMSHRFCGVASKRVDVCLNDHVRAPIADGQAVLDSSFNGSFIGGRVDENWGQVDDPDIDSALEREALVIEPSARAYSWGAVDNGLVGLAAAIPYAWLSQPELESSDVAGVGDLWNAGLWDLSFTSVRQPEP